MTDILPPRKFIETLIGTKINDIDLYHRAFTHKSALKRYGLTESFELLEFLGDSVLNFVITRYLIDTYPTRDEGFLTKLRTRLVRGKTLANIGRILQLNNYILMDEKGERNGWTMNDNILEDVFEAIVGAVYTDIGLPHAKIFIMNIFTNSQYVNIEKLIDIDDNYKDILMRYCQTNKYQMPIYSITGHANNIFNIRVYLQNYGYGSGSSRTKKSAEQEAAKNTLKILGL